MKTILALAPTPALAESVGQALPQESFRVLHRTEASEAEALLKNRFIDFCIVDAEPGDVRVIWQIEKVRQWAPQCPVLVYKGTGAWDWEEDAYLHGAVGVLSKPVRPKLLLAMLERHKDGTESTSPAPMVAKRAPVAKPVSAEPAPAAQTLNALKDFSAVLTQSLSTEGMLSQFLGLLRQTAGVGRAAVFIRRGTGTSYKCAASLGVAPGLLAAFELSSESGIGGFLGQNVRIVKRDSDEAAASAEMQKEFQLLGMHTAIPMLTGGQLAGVLLVDDRITGEGLRNQELELIYVLLEQVGLGLRNIGLHEQLAANNSLLGDVLRELTSACVVVNRNLGIVHANKAARNLLNRGKRNSEMEFSDLPNDLGIKVFQVLNTGTGIATFKHHPVENQQSVYQVSIVPVQAQGAPAALLIVEDYSQLEQLKRLEVETSNLRLVKTMADRLAHEIGNALVPLSTHQQLLPDKYKDQEFRASLEAALSDSVKRISRLTSQMRYLARDSIISKEALPLTQLLEEAFQEAQKYQPLKSANLKVEKREQPIVLAGDRAALKHAVAEVLLNALQANPSNAKVEVRTQLDDGGSGSSWVHIDIQDNGPGFSAEVAKKVPAPFFTTKNVGLGLGLAVTQKILETHRGKLVVLHPKKDQPSVVRISLPLDATAA